MIEPKMRGSAVDAGLAACRVVGTLAPIAFRRLASGVEGGAYSRRPMALYQRQHFQFVIKERDVPSSFLRNGIVKCLTRNRRIGAWRLCLRTRARWSVIVKSSTYGPRTERALICSTYRS